MAARLGGQREETRCWILHADSNNPLACPPRHRHWRRGRAWGRPLREERREPVGRYRRRPAAGLKTWLRVEGFSLSMDRSATAKSTHIDDRRHEKVSTAQSRGGSRTAPTWAPSCARRARTPLRTRPPAHPYSAQPIRPSSPSAQTSKAARRTTPRAFCRWCLRRLCGSGD